MSQKKAILVLGSGLVAKPGVQFLVENGFKVTLATRTLEKAQELIEKIKKESKVQNLDIVSKKLDIEKDDDLLDALTKEHDAVVSLLPYIFHAKAAKIAIKHKKHFFTTSYVNDDMRKLENEAKEAGIIMINECGVDPGTDHMSAMRVIDKVHKNGGKIKLFTSYCGGLPAPEDNNNPMGYKLSWAPRGVLLASRNPAEFLKDGKDVRIEGKDLFDNYSVEQVGDVGKFEVYPNRNSKQYIEIYGIPETETIIRGTYRNLGWCSTVKKLADLGYLSLDKQNLEGKTYKQLAQQIAGSESEDVKEAIAKKANLSVDDPIIQRFEWLGLFSDEKIAKGTDTVLDALCNLCVQKMKYNPGERDMLLMKHTFIAEYEDRKETLTTTLVDFGIKNGDTSMSRTVSLPVAIAVKLVLNGEVKLPPGLHIPTIPELYNPILDGLEKLGIKFIDKVEKVEKK